MKVRDFSAYFVFFSLHQMTSLYVAAEHAHVKIVEYLVDNGAGVNIQNTSGVNIRYYTSDGSTAKSQLHEVGLNDW